MVDKSMRVPEELVKDGFLVDEHGEVVEHVKLDKEMKREREDFDDSLVLRGKQGDVVPLDGYPYIKYDGVMEDFPVQARKMFGCHNCEWRGTSMCPFGIRRLASEGKVRHSAGVCEMRVNYLKNFYRGVKPKPGYTEWVNDYNQGVAQLQLQNDYDKLKRVEDRLAKYEGSEDGLSEEDRKRFKTLLALKSDAREEWFVLWKALMENDNKRIDRDTPRKIEIDKRETITVSDFQKIVGRADGVVVDADYEEIGGDDV